MPFLPIESFIPHPELLLVDVMITNGGYNGVQIALAWGATPVCNRSDPRISLRFVDWMDGRWDQLAGEANSAADSIRCEKATGWYRYKKPSVRTFKYELSTMHNTGSNAAGTTGNYKTTCLQDWIKFLIPMWSQQRSPAFMNNLNRIGITYLVVYDRWDCLVWTLYSPNQEVISSNKSEVFRANLDLQGLLISTAMLMQMEMLREKIWQIDPSNTVISLIDLFILQCVPFMRSLSFGEVQQLGLRQNLCNLWSWILFQRWQLANRCCDHIWKTVRSIESYTSKNIWNWFLWWIS